MITCKNLEFHKTFVQKKIFFANWLRKKKSQILSDDHRKKKYIYINFIKWSQKMVEGLFYKLNPRTQNLMYWAERLKLDTFC